MMGANKPGCHWISGRAQMGNASINMIPLESTPAFLPKDSLNIRVKLPQIVEARSSIQSCQ
jgi:hypothetical protein